MSFQDKRDLDHIKESMDIISSLADLLNKIDAVPTEGSEGFVTSGGVYDALVGKVDAVEGKGLSTEDFTTELKEKLDSIPSEIEIPSNVAYLGDIFNG